MSAMVSVYYNVIVMYALLYISLSLLNIGWQVPWASCNNEWNTKFCRTKPLPDLDSIVAVPERITASLGEYFLGQNFPVRNVEYMKDIIYSTTKNLKHQVYDFY